MSMPARLLVISIAIIASGLSYSQTLPRFCRTHRSRVLVPEGKPCLQNVHLTVYYESKCNASHQFLLKQVLPIANRKFPWLKITLIPFGIATIRGGKVECSKGPDECLLNRFQVCSFKHMKNEGPSGDLSRVKLAYCMMSDSRDDVERLAKYCLEKETYGLKWKVIKRCAEGREGIELQNKYMDEAQRKDVTFVPFVAFNEKTGPQYFQNLALEYLEALAIDIHNCEKVPPNCTTCCEKPTAPIRQACSCTQGGVPGPCCDLLAKGYQYEDRHIIRYLPPSDNYLRGGS